MHQARMYRSCGALTYDNCKRAQAGSILSVLHTGCASYQALIFTDCISTLLRCRVRQWLVMLITAMHKPKIVTVRA